MSAFRRHVALAVLTAVVALSATGCGGGGSASSAQRTHAQERVAIGHVRDSVWAIYDAFTGAEGARFCCLMTPRLRGELLAVAQQALPETREMACGRAAMRFLGALGRGPFPAMDDAGDVAGDYDFHAISVHGSSAVVRFPGARNWQMKLVGGHWLVDRFPILPKSLGPGVPSDLTRGQTAPA